MTILPFVSSTKHIFKYNGILRYNFLIKLESTRFYPISLTRNTLFLYTTSNVSQNFSKHIISDDSFQKHSNFTSNLHPYYHTNYLIKKLKLRDLDKFQSDIFSWIKSRCKTSNYHQNTQFSPIFDEKNESNIAYVVGGIQSGKTTSYLLSLSDIVNDPNMDGFSTIRDNYRSKIMVYGNLKGSKMFTLRNLRKINGVPKFKWNSYVVPLAIILVPFRELGQNIFDQCSSLNLRSRLLAGGKGYKKQTSLLGDKVNLVNKNEKDNVDVVISTPEILFRALNGEFEDLRIEMKFVKFLILEESDLLSDNNYLEKINQIINLVYTRNLNLLYISRFKTSSVINNIQQLLSIDRSDENFNVIEKDEKGPEMVNKVKKIFIHASNNDRLELLIDTIHEIRQDMKRDKIVIYCDNIKCNKFLRYSLLDRGFEVTNLFGDMNYDERSDNLKKFEKNSDILITTPFSSRFKFNCKVKNVILFNFPKSTDEYIHYLSSFSNKSDPSNKMFFFFNNKNLKIVKDIQKIETEINQFEYRNLSPQLSKKLYLHQKLVLKACKTSNIVKIGRKKMKLTSRKNTLSPKNKRIMKKFYLQVKGIKKVEFLRRRGILKKNHGLPKMPDKNVEMSDSQEFIKMQRSPDGFLQFIPKRRSRIKSFEDNYSYDKESIVIPGAPNYDSEPLEEKKHHRNTHF